MIKVFSTYTKDSIYDKKNKLIMTRKGGPAFFIENIFKKKKIKYELFFDNAEIDIKVVNGIGKGILKNEMKGRSVGKIRKDEVAIVSTVNGEWMLRNNFSEQANIFLDIQGYIRSSKKNKEIMNLDFWHKVFCLKGNEEEMKKVPLKIIEKQKERLLIITKGKNGSVIFHKGKEYSFRSKKIKAKDDIGAGDTFFANFILTFIKTKGDIIKSGRFATAEVEKFLSTK